MSTQNHQKLKKKPLIGTIFSSDSSSDDEVRRVVSDSNSKSQPRKDKPTITLKVFSDTDRRNSKVKQGNNETLINHATIEDTCDEEVPEGFYLANKSNPSSIPKNALIQYVKQKGKVVRNKYFKKYDQIGNSIVVGFHTHDRRNYPESLDNLKAIYVKSIDGGADPLKDTIEIPKNQWKSLRRDMIISYQKENNEYVHRSRFNSFLKGLDGSSRMSLTSERGFNYIANPEKLLKIHRHLTSNDKTLTFILEALRGLEQRVRQLELASKKNNTQRA